MAGRIRDEDIALVRERSPVADVIGEYVQLRSAGGGALKGLCPFHDEKSPSFQVSPARGLYHCFGCGVGGDVIRFVERIDHLSFAEAVERLASRAGIQLQYEQGGSAPIRQQGQRARLVEANQLAQQFYAEQLRGADAKPARDFLDSRGFDAAAAAKWGCGFAPGGWDALTSHLQGKGFGNTELTTAGLSRQSSRGSLIDRFHRRLLWPIRDITGEVVGFGARRLFDDDPIEAKYLNTPETPLYKKSNVLYGIDVAKRDIARRRQAVVVEGYTDVMACHLAGVETAVATCGTAFGAEHTGILRRLLMDSSEFRGEVIFTFDGDAAGQAAALRAFEDEQRFVLQTFVAVEPSGLDPCDLRLSKGDAAVRDLVARRQPLVQFALRAVVQKYDLDTTEGRMAALDAAAPLVAKVKDSAMRNRYAVDLDRYLGLLNEQFVLARVAEIAGRGGARRPARVAAPEQDARPRPDDPTLLVEREVLKVAIQIPQLAGPMFDTLEEPAFTHPTYLTIRQGIAAAGGCAAGRTGADWVERISEHCPDLVTRSVLTELAVEQMHTHNEPDGRYVAAQVAQLRGPLVDRQIGALKSKLQRTNPLEQPDDYTRLFGELVGLEQFRHGLREQAIGAL